MRQIQSTSHVGRKQKEALKSNEFNIVNIVKRSRLESPTQYAYDLKGIKGSFNSFRPQLMTAKNNNETAKNKENNQINIKLNFNSEIINNNYTPQGSVDLNSINKATNDDPHQNIKNTIKSKDKLIEELQSEIKKTDSLLMKIKQKDFKNLSPNHFYQRRDNREKCNDDAKGTYGKYTSANFLSKTKSTSSLSLTGNVFFQNLMKNSQTLSKTLMRKRRLMSPKCISSTSMNLEKNSRASSPLSTYSVKSGKNLSMRHLFKNKNPENHKEEQLKNLISLKKRMEKVFEGYNALCFDNINVIDYNKQKYQQAKQRVLFQNYFK